MNVMLYEKNILRNSFEFLFCDRYSMFAKQKVSKEKMSYGNSKSYGENRVRGVLEEGVLFYIG